MKSDLAKNLSKLVMRALAPVVQPMYSGIGSVILFHRMVGMGMGIRKSKRKM